MIKNFLFTGDTHGRVLERIERIKHYPPEETALVILGDVGLNFYMNKTDAKKKQAVQDTGYIIYCVRGNHEERPENLKHIIYTYDHEIKGQVMIEEEYPNIRYLIDGHSYNFEGLWTLVIGGAYSVDKYWRLGNLSEDTNAWTGWFRDEQLKDWEMKEIELDVQGKQFDMVLTHTCPYSWMPTDLFLTQVKQDTVDNTMEKWLDNLKDTFKWKIWLFGHFHGSRAERPGVEMLFTDIEDLNTIKKRWYFGKRPRLEWWMPKGPNYYMEAKE